jgi:4'-phosphopantetheinyl transferase
MGLPNAGVVWLSRSIDDVPASDEWLSREEASRIETLRYAKRRTEVRLARWTAKQAVVRALSLDDASATLAAIEIRAASTGAPMLFVSGEPSPVSVSMSDRADWAVCVLSHAQVGVGCDLELVEPRSAAFVRDWFTPAEQELVQGVAAGEQSDLLCNLVWSAKESALKVLQTGLRRDTRSVSVDVIDRDGLRRWARLVVRSEEGDTFPGWWCRYGDFLLTVAADADLEPPEHLEMPPRLAAATPSHRWMRQQ